MMNQHDQKVRLAAEEAFEESLHQLEERLLSDEGRHPSKTTPSELRRQNSAFRQASMSTSFAPQSSHTHSSIQADLQAFAEAAEEIEQFIQARH